MSEKGEAGTSKSISEWWRSYLGNREQDPEARALAARLRHATGVEALVEPAVHKLARSLELGQRDGDADRVIRLATVLAEVREHDQHRLAARLGAANAMSRLRFERLIRSGTDEIATAVRRGLPLVERRCNVAMLGVDLLFWNDSVRARWCFDYYGATPPQSLSSEENDA